MKLEKGWAVLPVLLLVTTLGLSSCSANEEANSSSLAPSPSFMLRAAGTGDPFLDTRAAAALTPKTAATISSGLMDFLASEAAIAPEVSLEKLSKKPVGEKAVNEVVPGASPDVQDDFKTPTSSGSTLNSSKEKSLFKTDSSLKDVDLNTPSANFLAGFTSLLQENVYLSGIAVNAIELKGPDDQVSLLAMQALDRNSLDLSNAVGYVSSSSEEKEFLSLWQDYARSFLVYATNKYNKDERTAADTKKASLEKSQALADFLFSFDKNSKPENKKLLREGLNSFSTNLFMAVERFATKEEDSFADLSLAVSSARSLGETASSVLTASLPGDSSAPSALFLSKITALLQSHVYLTGISVFTEYTAKGGNEGVLFKKAQKELNDNSLALSQALEEVVGQKGAASFLRLWLDQSKALGQYAIATASDDFVGKNKALADMDSNRRQQAALLEGLTKGSLPASLTSEALGKDVNALTGAVESLKTVLVK